MRLEGISYNPRSGVICKHGVPVSSVDHGYIRFQLGGHRLYAHRVAWYLTYGFWPSEIDHINRDKTDNRLVNLREATASTNSFNTDPSIQKGVKIGDNVMIWSNNHIGHNSYIGSHTYISSNVTISGHCTVGERCFFGVNSSVADFCNIGNDCFITMGSMISSDIKNDSTTVIKSTLIYDSESKVNRVLKKKYFD